MEKVNTKNLTFAQMCIQSVLAALLLTHSLAANAQITPERRAFLDERQRRYWEVEQLGGIKPQLILDFLRDYPEKGSEQRVVSEMRDDPAKYASKEFRNALYDVQRNRGAGDLLTFARRYPNSTEIIEARSTLQTQANDIKDHAVLLNPTPACTERLENAFRDLMNSTGLNWFSRKDGATHLISPTDDVLAALPPTNGPRNRDTVKNLDLKWLGQHFTQHPYVMHTFKGETEKTSAIEHRDYFDLRAKVLPDGKTDCVIIYRYNRGSGMSECECKLVK